MNNQTSIKYITALLENPQTITDGDQSSIALFRQTFPYFIPARYLVALESHKKSPYSPKMLTAIQPYLGDWIRFCEFLDSGNQAVSELASVNKVTDKKKVDIQPEPLVSSPDVIVAKAEPKPPELVILAIQQEDAQPEKIPAHPVTQAENIVLEEEVRPHFADAASEAVAAVPAAEVPSEINIPVPPVVQSIAEDISAPEWPADTQATTVAIPSGPEVVVAKEDQLIFDMPVAFVVEAPEPEIPAWPEAPQTETHATQKETPVTAEVAFGAIPLAPVPVVISEDDIAISEPGIEVLSEHTVAAPEPEPELQHEVVGSPQAEVVLFPEDPETIPDTTREAVEESDFAKAWAEMESQAAESVTTGNQIINDDESAVSLTETDAESDHDPLIFPIYTKDYFLQQGEKISEEIPLEISELKDTGAMSEEDKSLMVVMSFSEWLLHFKSTSEKQKEETKDQKALKTMWQKEKLAAAMEEENEEIPETVFEMAVNSISKEEGLVSESLADIYIKQGKYDKAIEMYRKLSLRNPQKSAYFARKIEEALKDKQS